MKCEICHERDAQQAITREKDGREEELYVCRECAKRERVARHQQSQRTRKASGLSPGVSMSVTQIGVDGEAAPPIVSALMDAFQGMVSDLEKAAAEKDAKKAPAYHDFPVARIAAPFRIAGGLHLEGLHLIGELDAVKRAAHALKLELGGIEADGVRDAGHVYRLRYAGGAEIAKRFAAELLDQERNARIRLFEEMQRVFGDAICRALAILKNCRLLAPGELFDLLSPLRLAAREDLLDGISTAEIERQMNAIDLTSKEDSEDIQTRDRLDAERADRMNAKFEEVMLNERGEEKLQ